MGALSISPMACSVGARCFARAISGSPWAPGSARADEGYQGETPEKRTWAIGERCEFFSNSEGRWLLGEITAVDEEGAVRVKTNDGVWLSPSMQDQCLRSSGEGLVSIIEAGELRIKMHGASYWTLYKGSGEFEKKNTVLCVWLHGGAGLDINESHMVSMQRSLRRHVLFLLPENPKDPEGRLTFEWGVAFTQEENKGGFGYINGRRSEPYLDALCDLVQRCAEENKVAHVLLVGYSIGGFGAYQLLAHRPSLFTVVAVVAGYYQGSMDNRAPQPRGTERLEQALERSWGVSTSGAFDRNPCSSGSTVSL